MIKTYSYKKDKDKYLTTHFQVEEFRSYNATTRVLTTDTILIDTNLVEKLEELYSYLDKKYGLKSIYITSGYRSSDFEKYLSGYTTGYHVEGMAADIMCYKKDNSLISSKDICLIAEDLGWLGIGYGTNYNHLDTRSSKSFFDETNGNISISSWYGYFNIRKDNTQYKVGDIVTINGVYVSSTSEEKLVPLITKGIITKIINNARNPYLLDNGKIGWVNDEVIITTNNIEYYPKVSYNGTSIVDALKSINIDSSYSDRSKIAIKNNIINYKGTANQNTKMLELLKKGLLIK